VCVCGSGLVQLWLCVGVCVGQPERGAAPLQAVFGQVPVLC
jgi:hypothetical protein